MAITLTLSEQTLQNISAGTPPGDLDDGTDDGSIGAEYELRMTMTVGGTLDDSTPITGWGNVVLYFNPGLFLRDSEIWPAGAVPPAGYTVVLPSVLTGGPYLFGLVGLGSGTPAHENGICYAQEDGSDLVLVYKWRMTADVRRHINTTPPSPSNPKRLLATTMATPPFVNTANSVYRSGSRPLMRWILKASKFAATSTRYHGTVPFEARWYGQNRAGTGAGELGAIALTEVERSGNIITDFTVSAWEPTIVRVRIPKNVTWSADTVCETAWIKTDNAANLGGTYLEDYGEDFQAGAVVDNTTHWLIERTINATEVIYGLNRYRLVVVVRAFEVADSTNIVTNSFFSAELKATAYPTPIEFGITGEILDYDRAPGTDFVRTTVVDHVEARVVLDKDAYDAIAGTPLGTGCPDGLLLSGCSIVAVNGQYCPGGDVGEGPGIYNGIPFLTKVGGTDLEDSIFLDSAFGLTVITSGGLWTADHANLKFYLAAGSAYDATAVWAPYLSSYDPPTGGGGGGDGETGPTQVTTNGPGAPWAVDMATDLKRIKLDLVDSGDSTVVMSRQWNNIAGVWTGIAGTNANNIVVTDIGGGYVQVAFEIPVAYLNELGLPNYGGTTILLQWHFEFDYPLFPWTVSYDYTQAMEVQDFGNFADVIQKIEFFSFTTGLPLLSMCDDDMVLVKVTLDPTLSAGREWHLRAYWNIEGYGYPDDSRVRPYDGTQEEEGYASPSGAFTTLVDVNLIDVPATFTNGVALFRFNHADVPQGEKPRIYVIAQPIEES